MLGAEEHFQLNFGMLHEELNRMLAKAIAPSVVSDEAKALAFEHREAISLKHIDAIQHFCSDVGAADSGRKGADNCSKIEIAQTLSNQSPERLLQRQDISFAVGMNTIGKENPESARERVDPEGSAGEAGVTIGAERKNVTPRTTITGVNVPTEAAASFHGRRALDTGHQFYGRWFKNVNTVEFTLVEEHAGIASQVRSGAEKAGMAGDSVHATSGGVMDGTAEDLAGILFALGWGDAAALRRKESGLGHFQRLEQFGFHEGVKGFAADAMNDFAEYEEIDVAIAEECPCGIDRFLGTGQLNPFCVARPWRGQGDIGRQPGNMSEQVAHGDLLF